MWPAIILLLFTVFIGVPTKQGRPFWIKSGFMVLLSAVTEVSMRIAEWSFGDDYGLAYAILFVIFAWIVPARAIRRFYRPYEEGRAS